MISHMTPDDNEEIDDETLKRQINLVSLIGNLFVRKLLAAKVMAQVVHDLIGVRVRQPGKHFMLLGAELLQVIGRCLDVSGQGNMLMTQFLARLSNLAASQRQDTLEACYPKEVRNVVKAVHESRFRIWPRLQGSQVLVRLNDNEEIDDETLKRRADFQRKGRALTCAEVCARLSQRQLRKALGARPGSPLTHARIRNAFADTLTIDNILLAQFPRALDLKLWLASKLGLNSIQISFVASPIDASGVAPSDDSPSSWLLPADGSDDTIRVVMLTEPQQLESDLDDSTMQTMQSLSEEPEIEL